MHMTFSSLKKSPVSTETKGIDRCHTHIRTHTLTSHSQMFLHTKNSSQYYKLCVIFNCFIITKILIQITFLIFNILNSSFSHELKTKMFTESRFQEVCTPPHTFCPLTFWTFLYEIWASELGIRILESRRESYQKLLIRDRVTEQRRGQTNYFPPLLRIYQIKRERTLTFYAFNKYLLLPAVWQGLGRCVK